MYDDTYEVLCMFMVRVLPEKARRIGLVDVTAFRTGGQIWSVGPKQTGLSDWLAAYLGKENVDIDRILAGSGLAFMAQVVWVRAAGWWLCMKNRFAEAAPMQFSSLEEARLVSAANGWPEPVRIC